MKRIWILGFVALLAGCHLGGCGGVMLNATYSKLLDDTTALAQATATRAAAGQLTQDQMVKSLQGTATVLQEFRDARDGTASTQP